MGIKHNKYIRITAVSLGLAVLIFSGFVMVNKADEEDWSIIPLRQGEADQQPLSPGAEVDEQPPLVIMFGGDIMLSRTVNAKINAYGDHAWPFSEIASTTSAADITVANLESPFLKDADYRVLTGSFSFKADPESLEGIELAGIDVLSLANNHMLNAGKKGVKDTLDILSGAGIITVGAGLDEAEARRPAIVESRNKKVAFLAYAYSEDNSVASVNRPGIAGMDIRKMEEDVVAAKAISDIVIVQMHAGTEYVSQPGKQQKDFAHAAIDAGADAVIGHHPHWPQSWEIYNNKPIFYSLGNFIFDQMWSEETSNGLIARLTFEEDGSGKAELIPIKIEDYGQAKLWPQDKSLADFYSLYDLPVPEAIAWTGNGDN